MTAELFVKGLLLGIGAAAPIGPVNVEIARRTLKRGFAAGFALGCGAVTVDVFYAIVTSVGLASLINRPIFYWTMTLGGLVLLSYLGIMCVRSASRESMGDRLAGSANDAAPLDGAGKAYVTGLLMTLLNPMTLGFWFVAVPGVMGQSITLAPSRDLPMICSGVFVATIGWVVCFAGLMKFLGRFRRRWWLVAADAIGGAVLLGFAALLLLRSIRAIL